MASTARKSKTASGAAVAGPGAARAGASGAPGAEGDVVYDPFLGSGTTLVAAEQLNRTCVGLEIDPAYCDVIVERWQNLTGGQARREPA
jgi:tRNA G10  N-methylase Trm11